jgi:hypothetical protein
MTYITGKMTMGISGQTVDTAQRKYDIDPEIRFLAKALAKGAFYFAIQGPKMKPKKKVCIDPTFKHFEKDPIGHTGYLSAAIIAGDTTIAIDDGAAGAVYAIKVGDVISLVSSDQTKWENILVTAVNSASAPTSITASRNFGNQTAASNWDDNTEFIILVNIAKEDYATISDRVLKSVLAGAFTNYCFYNTTPYGGTRRAIKTQLQTGKSWDEMKKEAWILHTEQNSRFLMFGQAKAETTYGRTSTDGLISRIKGGGGKKVHIGGNISFAAFMDFMEELFDTDPGGTKMAGCSAIGLTMFDTWKKSMLQMKSSEEFMGVQVTDFGTSHGNLILYREQNLNGPWDGSIVFWDPDNITYRYFQDDDTHTNTNIQDNADQGRVDEYASDIGLQVDHAASHGLMTGIVGIT